MLRVVTALVLTALGGSSDNLLVNPGFETLDGDTPEGWNLFVEPQEGSEGGVEGGEALQGKYCVRLHNAEAYEREPANNWSQSIIADLGGAELLVAGNVKTTEATEAALWVQCFKKHPCRILYFGSTSTDSPFYGTRGWTSLTLRFAVPEQTDFIMVRCVLKGTGTAWFDELKAEVVGEAPDVSEDDSEQDEAERASDSRELDRQVRESLIEAHRVMIETNRALRETNEALAEQIAALQAELRVLRSEIEQRSGPAAEPLKPMRVLVAPPLVPHGYDWERLLE